MKLDYRVLGPMEAWAGSQPVNIGGPRQQRLLGALLLAEGRPVPPDRLVDIVWLGEPPDQARNTLRTYVTRLRRALEVDGEAPVTTDTAGYALALEPDSTDRERFESLLGAARSLAGDPIATLAPLDEALALWRGPAFGEFADEDWCAGEAVRLDELRRGAMEDRFDAMLASGLYRELAGEVEAFITEHPLRERARGQLMVALYRQGRHVEAIRLFQDYRRYLDEEIGVEPSADLRALEQQIVARDPSLEEVAPAGRALRGYQLGRRIGQGAFGTLYRASQPSVGREVAIKVVRAELADDPEFIRRFDAEAQIIARLEHPHIVPLFDYWREPGGAYLVMRYLRGGSAEQRLAEHGPLPVDAVARLAEEVGGALASAHARGIVHRDVKPANILFDEHGNSYLADFGIATDVGTEDGASAVSSPVYSSPEQVGGGESAPSADIYALGAVLYELLTGAAPFRADTPLPDLLERKSEQPIPSLRATRPDLPDDVDAVIQRATAPQPGDRFADIGEMLVAFRAATTNGDGRHASTRKPISLAAANPYKGLAAFDEADAGDFFGRGELVDRLFDVVQRSRFVAVVGPSGSGKSSVVRAGLIPRLRAAGSFITAIVPGSRPMGEMETALLRVAAEPPPALLDQLTADPHGLSRAVRRCLPDDDSELVVVVDQFEELFTLAGPETRDEFLAALAAAATDDRSRVRIVVTLRADFYDRPLGHPAVSELVQANTVAVTPLTPDELERAIAGPAARVGVSVDPALSAELVADVSGSPASLPLLQYVLTESFEHRVGDQLTVDAYREVGGISGAVAQRADDLFERFDESAQRDTRMMFARLVAIGEGPDDTRSRIRRVDLAAISADVIDGYAEARLLTLDRDPESREPTIEIAHEALLREWPRLRNWIADDRDGLRTMRHLAVSAAEWEAEGRDPAALYRGSRLLAADDWDATHDHELTATERSFLDSSRRARDADSALARRRVRRLGVLVISLALISVAALVAGAVAWRERQSANDSAAEAQRRALENRSGQLASEAVLAAETADPDLAILLALAAHETSEAISDTPQPGVIGALHQTVQASRLEGIIAAGGGQIAVHPDGRHLVLDAIDDGRRLLLYDIESGEVVTERLLDELNGGLAYSPDGSLLAVTLRSFDGRTVRGPDLPAMVLLDGTSLETVTSLDGGGAAWLPSWSDDGQSVLTQERFGEARMWNIDRAEVARVFAGPDAGRVTFIPGTNVIGVLEDGRLEIVDRDGEVVRSMDAPPSGAWAEFSPGGGMAAFVDFERGQVQVTDLESGDELTTIEFPGNPRDVRFSPDGTRLSIVGNADVAHVVDLATGEVMELRGQGPGSGEHSFSAAGDRLFVVRFRGSTRVWNLEPGGPERLGNLFIGGTAALAGAAAADAVVATVVTGFEDAHVTRVDPATGGGERLADFWYASFLWPVASRDGTLTGGFSPLDLVASVTDTESGDVVLRLRPCEAVKVIDARNRWVLVDHEVCPAADQWEFADDARRGFVDLDTGELIAPNTEQPVVAVGVVGPEGSLAEDVVVTTGDRVVFRRASTLETLAVWNTPPDIPILRIVFSSDGATLGASSQSRDGFLFDVEAILDGASASEALTELGEMTIGPNYGVVPVGEHLVVSDGGDRIRLLDRATGAQLADVPTDAGGFVTVFAMPDDRTVFYQDAGGVLRRFLTDVDDLVDVARSAVQRTFTDDECAQFFPAGDCPQ